jgi:hypothetical protein
MKSINIKGSNYITVNERLKYFRSEETFSGWRIQEQVIEVNEKEGIFLVTIHDSEGNPMVSAHAQEYRDNSYINKTSFLENGFTSALGRALGYLGIGIDTSIASADEVATAIHNQEKDDKPWLTEAQLQSTLKSTKDKAVKVLDSFKMKNEYKKQIVTKFNI